MEIWESYSHYLLYLMLELAGIIRNPEKPLFSSKGLKLYIVVMWASSFLMSTSGLVYALDNKGNMLSTMFLVSASISLGLSSISLVWNRENVRLTLEFSLSVLKQLSHNEENIVALQLAGETTGRYFQRLSLFMMISAIVRVVQAGIKTYFTSERNYPFNVSCMGLPLVPCWLMQIFSSGGILWLAASLSKSFGITSFIDITFAAIRNCFQTYDLIMAISNRDSWIATGSVVSLAGSIFLTQQTCSIGEELAAMNSAIKNAVLESSWYGGSPAARKRLLPLLILVNTPIQYHYKHFMIFDREKLGQVLRGTYSLTTALANFI